MMKELYIKIESFVEGEDFKGTIQYAKQTIEDGKVVGNTSYTKNYDNYNDFVATIDGLYDISNEFAMVDYEEEKMKDEIEAQ